MRAIDPQLQAKLDQGATTLCRCWLLTRADGVALAFTDHDGDLSFDGHVFQAGSGMTASALESSTGLSVDNSQAVGALSSVGLTESDIRSGKFDGAQVRHWIVDWTDPSLRVLLFSGFLGEIRRGDVAFEVELRGLSEQLNTTVGRSYQKRCDRSLGDKKCGFDLNTPGYMVAGSVSETLDNRRFMTSGLVGFTDGWFTHGQVRWDTGANAGLTGSVKFDKANGLERRIELWREMPNPMAAGDALTLIAGCDKSSDACRGKFLNFANFRGFPHIPGEDWAHAYPAQGGRHDGSSRYR